METVSVARCEELKREWTNEYVQVNPDRPELRRFGQLVGRVVTVNYNGKALIDFADGGWYDITASPEHLRKVTDPQLKSKHDPKANSAQPFPDKQG